MKTEKLSTKIRKGQIIKSVLQIIRKKGLKSVTIAEIAKNIGLVPSAVYRHYPCKDDILMEVLNFIENKFKSNIIKACNENTEPISVLKSLLENQVKMMLEVTPVFPRILLSDEIFSKNPKLRNKVCEIFDSFLGSIEAVIKKGQKNRSIKNDISAKSMAVLFLGLFQPPSFFLLLNEGKYDIKKQINDAWLIFEKAVKV